MEPRLLTLVDNVSLKPGLRSAWGLSILVDLSSIKMLFDVGPSFDLLLSNAEALSLNLSELEAVFISHMHADHVGALNGLLAYNPKLKVYLPDPKLKLAFVRSGFEAECLEEPAQIAEGVYATGVLRGAIDEQMLLIQAEGKTVMLTGCTHPGIKEALEAAIKASPTNSVYAVIGGLHIGSASEALDAWAYMREVGVAVISPCHCTSPLAKSMLAKLFAEGYVENGVGCEIRLNNI